MFTITKSYSANVEKSSEDFLLFEVLNCLLQNPFLHRKWLNTLSLLEYAGALRMVKWGPSSQPDLKFLQHVSEETRHALFFKKHIFSVPEAEENGDKWEKYSPQLLLAYPQSKHYIPLLDVKVCQYLKRQFGFQGKTLQAKAYLLTTYAIEVRAMRVYSLYDALLKQEGHSWNLKGILLEEAEHLREMTSEIRQGFPGWKNVIEDIQKIEIGLYEKWRHELCLELGVLGQENLNV